ncbi:alpha/beta hydrolase [Pontiella sulfatireligans]|uniref:Acetyl esterase n=1 Tax=Pontiella sulfatireligans TaxID=2750658 RepID=A0A6C2UJ06_9BACT|nr:alpha/beta hydrolase [Pontiella sulfatireligans]VGO19401.1 Acetyl esterase [Pontiella sulfatireligans]
MKRIWLSCFVLVSVVAYGGATWEKQQAVAEKAAAEYQAKYPDVSSDKIVFKTVSLPDGRMLELDFRIERPKEGGPFPVVFYVHGGGWVSGSKSVFTHQSFVLAEHGMAGVRLEYRWKSQGAKVTEALSDVMDAIDYVRQHAAELNLDFSRVGLAGSSAGGHLSALAAQMTPECICYDGYNGLFDAFNRDRSRFGGGNYTGTTEKEKKAASALYNIKTPPPDTFLYHGTADTTIDIRQSYRFAEALRKKGGAAEVLVYEGAGHAFCNKEPYLTATTEALLAHTANVFGLTDKKPVLSDDVLTLNNDPDNR